MSCKKRCLMNYVIMLLMAPIVFAPMHAMEYIDTGIPAHSVTANFPALCKQENILISIKPANMDLSLLGIIVPSCNQQEEYICLLHKKLGVTFAMGTCTVKKKDFDLHKDGATFSLKCDNHVLKVQKALLPAQENIMHTKRHIFGACFFLFVCFSLHKWVF
jgi:hypothetical protein